MSGLGRTFPGFSTANSGVRNELSQPARLYADLAELAAGGNLEAAEIESGSGGRTAADERTPLRVNHARNRREQVSQPRAIPSPEDDGVERLLPTVGEDRACVRE